MLRLLGGEFRHHFLGEQFQAFADMLVRVLAGLIEQDDLIDMAGFEPPQLLPDGFGGPDQAATQRLVGQIRVRPLPLLILVPQADRSGGGAFAIAGIAVIRQRKLEERHPVRSPARFLIGFRAHEVADHGDVAVGLVVRQLLLPQHKGVVVGVNPGIGHVGGQELEAQRADAAAAGHLDRFQLGTCDP